jgi:uncharacterized membrane protein YccF (DUF307 family)
MSGRIVIFGYGPTGRATAARLLAEGREVGHPGFSVIAAFWAAVAGWWLSLFVLLR